MNITEFVSKTILGAHGEDAISLLIADHEKVQDLFKQFAEIKDVTDAHGMREKQRIAAAACFELTVHTKLEDEIFYPAVRAAVDDDDLMNEAKVEHEGAKALIGQIEEMNVKDAMFNGTFTVLSEYVNHHIREEHTEMFPKARAAELDLDALGHQMMARKRELTNGAGPARPRATAKKRVAARKPAARRHAAPAKQ